MCLQVRKHIYHDADNLDTAFDAGGKVSIGLTATTIVSQWTWSATLLQSSTVASKVKNSWKIPLGSQSLPSVFLKKWLAPKKSTALENSVHLSFVHLPAPTTRRVLFFDNAGLNPTLFLPSSFLVWN